MPLLTTELILDLDEFCREMLRAPLVAIDTETTGLNIYPYGENYATGLSIAYRREGYGVVSEYFAFRHNDSGDLEPGQKLLLKDTIEQLKLVTFHNAKFDLPSLKTLGIDYKNNFYCTMVLAHLIDENKPYAGKKLNACTKLYLNGDCKKDSPDWEAWQKAGIIIPSWVMREYAAYDTDLTLRLCEVLLDIIRAKEPELLNFWDVQKGPLMRLVSKMEQRGVHIDVPLCEKMTSIGETQMEEYSELLGGLNPASPKDLEKLLIDELGLPEIMKKRKNNTESRTFDKGAMEIYERILEHVDNPTARYILAYRGWQKSVSSNYRPYVELLSPDGRLRPHYRHDRTVTGRMSCEKPNLQQIPRVSDKPWNGVMKSAFIPREGYTLYEADYSQLELRLATAYAKVPELIKVFEEGRDIFTEMSERIGLTRQDTKTFVYLTQYGGGVNRTVQSLGVTHDRAKDIQEQYKRSYPRFVAIANQAQNKAKLNKQVQLWSRRYRHFQWPKEEAHKAFNSVIQGGAADIMERSMLRVEDAVDNDEECRMLLQVHDSIVFEIKNGKEDEYLPEINKAMSNVEPDFGVKFAVDVHVWGH